MATLTIRNVDTVLNEWLRIRAVLHGRSIEAELLSILSEALERDRDCETNLAEAIRRRFAPLGGVELDSHLKGKPGSARVAEAREER
jgi:plasmid stability protein